MINVICILVHITINISLNIYLQHDGPGGAMEFLVKVYYTGGAFAKDQVSRGTSVRVGGLAPGTDYTFSVMAFLPLPNGRRAQSPESSLASAKTQGKFIMSVITKN